MDTRPGGAPARSLAIAVSVVALLASEWLARGVARKLTAR